MTRTGHCLCGEVKLTAENPPNVVGACHCKMCRRWGGGPYMEVDCGPDITFEGEQHIGIFDSSKWAERGFCKICGTHLFYRLKASRDHMVPVGVFDDDGDLSFERQVFVDEKPHYYSFSNKTQELTGAEIFALYAPKD